MLKNPVPIAIKLNPPVPNSLDFYITLQKQSVAKTKARRVIHAGQSA